MKKSFKYFDVIVAVFAASLLISNLAATKLIEFNLGSLGHIVTDGGAILFPLVYILDDVLTEVYGFKYARRAIWTGFGVMLLAVLCFTVVRYSRYHRITTTKHHLKQYLASSRGSWWQAWRPTSSVSS